MLKEGLKNFLTDNHYKSICDPVSLDILQAGCFCVKVVCSQNGHWFHDLILIFQLNEVGEVSFVTEDAADVILMVGFNQTSNIV